MLDLLTGASARDLLAAALEVAGGELMSWRARQVDLQPGSSVTVSYDVKVRWPDRVTEERMGACVGRLPKDTFVLDNGEIQAGIWRYPHDPWLPGLVTAADPIAVAGLLESLGIGHGPATLRMRAYRPRRRAVIEAANSSGRVFLKVVPQKKVKNLHDLHRIVADSGFPAPRSLGFTEGGVLVLQALPGQSMREMIRVRDSVLPGPADLLSLLDRLPPELLSFAKRPTWTDRAGHYAGVIAHALPVLEQRALDLAEALKPMGTTPHLVPVHGDFYESQLQLHRGAISGVLDLDTAGAGERIDDLACLLGHLSVLAQIDRPRAGRISKLGARYLTGFECQEQRPELRRRIAAVVLSLATGPHRVQENGWEQTTRHRLELAEQWLMSA
jgi:hypothetical protein